MWLRGMRMPDAVVAPLALWHDRKGAKEKAMVIDTKALNGKDKGPANG